MKTKRWKITEVIGKKKEALVPHGTGQVKGTGKQKNGKTKN